MYCPSCGKDNPEPARFCRGCGRNLAVILQSTQVEEGSAFARVEYRLDDLIASHASRYFKTRANPFEAPTTLKGSWKLLGQGFLAFILDLFYNYLIFNFVLQFRFVVLLFKSPVMWWQERQTRRTVQSKTPTQPAPSPVSMTQQLPNASVTEGTTELFSEPASPRREHLKERG